MNQVTAGDFNLFQLSTPSNGWNALDADRTTQFCEIHEVIFANACNYYYDGWRIDEGVFSLDPLA